MLMFCSLIGILSSSSAVSSSSGSTSSTSEDSSSASGGSQPCEELLQLPMSKLITTTSCCTQTFKTGLEPTSHQIVGFAFTFFAGTLVAVCVAVSLVSAFATLLLLPFLFQETRITPSLAAALAFSVSFRAHLL